MSEERNDEMQSQKADLQALFTEAQETIEEAKERKAKEDARFAKVEYFTMDKEGTYKIRILPLPPTSSRRGYEFPLHEIMLKIVNPDTEKVKYVNCCLATEAGISVDLISTYRKMAVAFAKKSGDSELEKKLNEGSFGGGLRFDYLHAMRIFDLDNDPNKMILWKSSNGQFGKMETAKLEAWNQLIEANEDPRTPCPISSWNAAYPVSIIKSKKNKQTEYSFSINVLKKCPALSLEQLQALMDAPALSDIIYRFTKYHLEAEIEFLKQYDEKFGFDFMESKEIQDVIEKIKGELPADDTSSFSFGKDDDKEGGEESDDNATFEQIADLYDKACESGCKEKSEEVQDIRNMIVEYINRKGLNIKVMRTKTTEMLLNEVEDVLNDMDGEPKDKPEAKAVSVGRKAAEEPASDSGKENEPVCEPENNEPANDNEPAGDGSRSFDTNEPAAPARRRRRNVQ